MTGGFATAARYWHTLRHLRPVQFYRRLWFRVSRPKPRCDPAPLPRGPQGAWIAPARYRASLVAPTRFRFLNEEHDLADIGWDKPTIAKLWRYNQHYFTDLVAVGAAERVVWHRRLFEDWIERNQPGEGTGWEPYPLSLRLVNIIKWASAGNALSPATIDSLAIQARWLEQRIEWHLLANHLFVNGKALLFAGAFFTGPEADRWRRKGLAILSRELDEQILADGAQFELSPMYHALALDDVLDLINVMRRYSDVADSDLMTRLVDKAGPMQDWLAAMCHPDGEIALFNDAAIGIAPAPAELVAYASRLGLAPAEPARTRLLSPSGYFRLAAGTATVIGDVAMVGPPYQAGHAHADTLSFELSIGSQRVFVNGGTSVYGLGEQRTAERSTCAHNTVMVAGRNSSDVWGGFRVGRRARPFGVSVTSGSGIITALGAHDGYCNLPGRPVHNRSWRLKEGSLQVEDVVTVPDLAGAAYFHLHPDVVVRQNDAMTGSMSLPDGSVVQYRAAGSAVALRDSVWHPEFGVGMPTNCLVVSLDRGRAALELSWN